MSQFRRRRLFIDSRVQGALLLRVVCYWGYCLLTLALMLTCWEAFSGPPRRFAEVLSEVYTSFGPAAVASILLLPLVLMDVLRMSNRFAGPLYRIRKTLRDVAEGQPITPITFRDGDFWQEVAADFNIVLHRLEELERQKAEGNSPQRDPESAVGDAEPQAAANASIPA